MPVQEFHRQWPEQLKRMIVTAHQALQKATTHERIERADNVVESICAEFGGERVYFPNGVRAETYFGRKSGARSNGEDLTKPQAERRTAISAIIETARESCEAEG